MNEHLRRALPIAGLVAFAALSVLPSLGAQPWLAPLAIVGAVVGWHYTADVPRRDDARFAIVLVAAFLSLLAFSWTGKAPWGYVGRIVAIVLIYGVLTLGLSLQFSFCGLINFGHVASMALGAYAVGLFTTTPGFGGPAGMALGILAGAAVSVVWALLMGIPTLRLRDDYLAIVTITAGEMLRLVIKNEDQWTGGASGLHEIPTPLTGIKEIIDGVVPGSGANLSLALASVVAIAFVAWLLNRLVKSPWGRTVRAVRDDEDAAAGVGAPVVKLKMQALALGGVVAALAGVLFAWHALVLNPQNFDPLPTFYAWTILILGGLGSLRGAIAGSAIFWVIFEAPRWLDLPGIDSQRTAALRLVLMGFVLMLVVTVKPEGLFGSRDELEVME